MVVKIKLLICIIFIFINYTASSTPKTVIIRDAEIEFFLSEIIKSVSESNIATNKLYQPVLISNNEYNAFVTGTNKIYVNTGLIHEADSLNEIQGVFAHEIGHLVLNHVSSRSINNKNLSNYSKFATVAGVALSSVGKLNSHSAIGLMLGTHDLASKSAFQFSRIQEKQADKFALDLMKRKKISFDGLEKLLLKLSNNEASLSNYNFNYYRSHPFSKQRLNQLKKYKSQVELVNLKNQNIYINNYKIRLDYIKNKIRSYQSDPFKLLKANNNQNVFFDNYSKIIAYKKVGKYDLAYKSLEKLQKKHANYPFYYELAGDIHFAAGKYPKSIENYKKALYLLNKDFLPSTDIIKLSLVKSYLKTNQIDALNRSKKLLEEMLHNNPKWSLLWRLLAKTSGKLGHKGISYIALAEEALIKKNFIKAKKYVDIAFKQKSIKEAYKLRGLDILAKIEVK